MERPLPQWLRTKFQELGIQHKVYEIDDDSLEDILSILAEVCDLMDEQLRKKEGVLVHCGLGVSRSGSMVVGYSKLSTGARGRVNAKMGSDAE